MKELAFLPRAVSDAKRHDLGELEAMLRRRRRWGGR